MAKTKKQPAAKRTAPASKGAKAIGALPKPWPETMRGKEYGGDATKARLAEAIKAIREMPIAGVVANEYEVAVTVTCSNCSADVGELCVGMKGRGRNRKPVVCYYAHQERISAGESARDFIDEKLAERKKDAKAPAPAPAPKKMRPGDEMPGPSRYPANTMVYVRWEPNGKPKRGLLVRWNGAGNPVVKIARVDAKGMYTGELGSERVMVPTDIVGTFDEPPRPEDTAAMGVVVDQLRAHAPASSSDAKPTRSRATSTRDAKKPPADAPRSSGACKIAGCPARFENTVMPPDWQAIDGFLYCPPHVVQGQRIAVEVAKSREATADHWKNAKTTPIADMERAMSTVPETPTAIGNAPTLVDAKRQTQERAASRAAAGRDVDPTSRIGEAWNACEFRIAPSKARPDGERCVKSFGGTDAPKGWTEIQLADGTIEYWCEGHRGAAMTRLAHVAEAERKELPDPIRDTRRADGMPEADIVAIERVSGGGEVVPRKNDNVGACKDPSCRARFYTRMPQTWEWWKGAFWCPSHIPQELRDIIAGHADVDVPGVGVVHVVADPRVPPGVIEIRQEIVDDRDLPADEPSPNLASDEPDPWDDGVKLADVVKAKRSRRPRAKKPIAIEPPTSPDPWDEPAEVAASSSDTGRDPWDDDATVALTEPLPWAADERDPWDEVA